MQTILKQNIYIIDEVQSGIIQTSMAHLKNRIKSCENGLSVCDKHDIFILIRIHYIDTILTPRDDHNQLIICTKYICTFTYA